MKKLRLTISLLILGTAVAACGRDPAPETTQMDTSPAEITYAPQLGVDINAMTRTESGLYYQDLEPGQGQVARAGDHVVVHYTGWLPQGQEFDSSRGSQPFEFVLGEGMVIPGWDEGVAGMQEGGRRRLVIPSDLAYGPEGAGGVIPPNATLVFDVELLDVR